MYIDRWKVQSRMAEKQIPSFTELARRMDMPKQSITVMMQPGRGFKSPTLYKLICVLECTPNDVLTWECDPSNDVDRQH